MKVAFFGTPESAVPSLRATAGAHEITCVVTRPDRPVGRGRRPAATPVADAAAELGLPLLRPETTRGAGFRDAVRQGRPDVLVVVAYGRIFGPKLLALARHGAVNVHFSLLPRWRGAAPVQRAILAGDAETGVSTMRLVEELDAGPVYLQAATPIESGEHAPALESRLADMGADLLLRTLAGLGSGGLVPVEQDHARATAAPALRREEGWLDPRRDAQALARAVRALDPWPGTWLALPGGSLAVLDAQPSDESAAAPPGTVMTPRGAELPVACGRGVLLVRRARPAGRAAMDGRSLVNGRHVAVGSVAAPPEAS